MIVVNVLKGRQKKLVGWMVEQSLSDLTVILNVEYEKQVCFVGAVNTNKLSCDLEKT